MQSKMKASILFFILFLVLGFTVKAQDDHDHDHGENGVHESHHKNEIGVANAPVYFLKEKEFSYGLHFHYVRTLGTSKFGLGLGYEQIFDEHEHKTFGAVFSYRPYEEWSLNVSPGFTFEKSQSTEMRFALHIETAYEFEFNNFHIGPAAEVAYDPEDFHFSLGLHIGYGF